MTNPNVHNIHKSVSKQGHRTLLSGFGGDQSISSHIPARFILPSLINNKQFCQAWTESTPVNPIRRFAQPIQCAHQSLHKPIQHTHDLKSDLNNAFKTPDQQRQKKKSIELRVKSKSARYVLIAFTAATLLPLTGFAKPKQIMTTDILQNLRKGDPWDRGVFTATQMVMFQQVASGGTDANIIVQITLSYFTSTDCTATNGTIVPTYTTPSNAPTFGISTTRPFGMVAASAWKVGNSKVNPTISTTYPGNDINNIMSIAVTFKSTSFNTPQASFTGISFACVPVTCSGGECTSGSGTQSFQLKTEAAIGDPADGGVIACMNGLKNNLVIPKVDNSTGIGWGGSVTSITNATSATDGSTNTTNIVNCLTNSNCPSGVTVPTQTAASNYAAGICSIYSAAGGFTSGWFLPAGNNLTSTGQLNCLYTNRATIGGFGSSSYWSSTNFSATNARSQNFSNGTQNSSTKTSNFRVRCARSF